MAGHEQQAIITDRVALSESHVPKRTPGRDALLREACQDLQFAAYALAYRTLFGQRENALGMDVLVRTKQPKARSLITVWTEHDIECFARLAQQVERAITAEVYYPNEDFMCSGCRYEDMCGEW